MANSTPGANGPKEGGEFRSQMSAHGGVSSSERPVPSGQKPRPRKQGAGQAPAGLMQRRCQASSRAPAPRGYATGHLN